MHMQVRAAQRATEINPLNQPPPASMLRALGPQPTRERIALLVARRWPSKGVKLTVDFLDNASAALRARILLHMNAWSKTANVQFVESHTDPQVRIARLEDPPEMSGYWSYLGTDILEIPRSEPTMNLEGFTMDTSEGEFHRVVRHETGHTLGFPHEHMRRELVERIDAEKAISFFGRTQNWTPDEVRAQVLTPIEESSILGTPHADQQSIMCYQIPGFLTTDGEPILGGTDIDASDFAFAGSVYPKQTAPVDPGSPAKPAGGCCGEYRSGHELGHGLISGDTFENKLVTYAKIGGSAIFEGDIVLDGRLRDLPGPGAERSLRPEPSAEIVQQNGQVERAIVITGAAFRWPNGVIPFEIDATLPAAQQTAANNAIAHWRGRTRLAFVQRTAQNQAQFPDFIRFVPGGGCSSAVGRVGGRQDISLAGGCFTGQAIHEIGHAVGLWHEQSREDRGRFITIDWSNIQVAQRSNFDQHVSDGDDVGEYDYGSIMHYGAGAFAIDTTKPTIVPTRPGAVIGQRNGLSLFDTAGVRSIYRSLQPPQGRTWRGNFTGDGRMDLLSYVPSRFNWFLGSWRGGQLGLQDVGGTQGFGQVGDGRPFWVGDFNGDGRDDVLFYYPGDDNWWLGSYNGTSLAWSLAGNTRGFGHGISDGRPFWSGRFSRRDRSEILFYFPGDDNWWLGTMANGNTLTWAFAGNTRGFGHAINDGRPFWISDFTGDGRSDILFYTPADDNWWLGTFNGTALSWSLAGNTRGFGHLNDGRPMWIGDFNGDGKSGVLFYSPGDDNWWLGTFAGTTLTWALAGNTRGFGRGINDGRPFWIGDLNGDGKQEVLFYYPVDHNWWMATFAGNTMTWSLVGNTAGFGRLNDGRPVWVDRFANPAKASVVFYFPVDGKWWIGTLDGGGRLAWSMAGDF